METLLAQKDYASVVECCLQRLNNGESADELWFYLALARHEQAMHLEANEALQIILSKRNIDPNVYALHSSILMALQKPDEALEASLQGCRVTKNAPQFLLNAAAICQQTGRYEESIHYYQQVLSLRPLDMAANLQLAATYTMAGSYQQAQKLCKFVIEQFPADAEVYNIQSEALLQIGDWDSALLSCEEGLRLNIKHTFLWFRRGLLQSYQMDFDGAQDSFQHAIAMQKDVAQAYFSSGKFDAIHLDTSKVINPRLLYLEKAYEGAIRCDWELWDHYPRVFAEYLSHTPKEQWSSGLPFRIFSRPIGPELRLKLVKGISTATEITHDSDLISTAYSDVIQPQLKIGYISADFYQHPTSILTRQLYRLHDRLKFKVYAYATAKPKGQGDDIYRKEVAANCDVFRDISDIDNLEAAEKIRKDGINILVDLGQYATLDGQLGILAFKPAPIQVNYLAFMATTGANYIDYAIVDHYIAPNDLRDQWTEALVRMPHSLYLYDNEINQSSVAISRQQYGLPEEAVVLCCFNNDYKIDPEIFNVWMIILRSVPSSVLWLLGGRDEVKANLRRAALSQGVAVTRLVFGERVSLEKHLQRYQLADLFLDTYWFNGHTTALEALWQGLPVLTRRGKVASSRVAASFLEVLGLPELIVNSYESYQSQAIFYAKNVQARILLRERLKSAKRESPLFNTRRTVKHLELAYELMWSAYLDKKSPKDIDVPEIRQLDW